MGEQYFQKVGPNCLWVKHILRNLVSFFMGEHIFRDFVHFFMDEKYVQEFGPKFMDEHYFQEFGPNTSWLKNIFRNLVPEW